MNTSGLHAALEAELAAGSVREAGTVFAATGAVLEVEPVDGDALSATLRVLGEHRAKAVVRGHGTRDQLGNLMSAVDVVLSTRSLSGIDELDLQDGVVHAGAGTTLEEINAAGAPHGWELPLGAPAGASIGGTLATASVGPRRLGQGPPRDCVLGLEVVLGSSERTRCGGRVVKNVTGFDLAKLYTGSFGCLGVIESGWLRLRPSPEATSQAIAPLGPVEDPIGLAIEASRRPAARCCAVVDAPLARRAGVEAEGASNGGGTLVVEFAGPSPSVREDSRWLAEACAGREAGLDAVEALGTLQAADVPVRARLAVLPSACRPVASALREAGAACIVHPGVGLVYAIWDDPEDAAGASAAVAAVAARFQGDARFELLPHEHRPRLDVFGVGTDSRSVIERMRALKQRFDPEGVLNPGRFLGRL